MIAEITVIPQVERSALSETVRAIAAGGLRYQPAAAGASVEGELDAILAAVRAIDTRLRAHGVEPAVVEVRLQLEPQPPADRDEQLTLVGPPHDDSLLFAQEHKGYGYDEGERRLALRT